MKKGRGQVSLEYAVVFVAIFFGLIIIGVFLFNYSNDSIEEVTDIQLAHLCTQVIDQAETVYYEGEFSKRTMELTIPGGIANISLERQAGGCEKCTELRFNKRHTLYNSSVYCKTAINLTANLTNRSWSQGKKTLTVYGKADYAYLEIT